MKSLTSCAAYIDSDNLELSTYNDPVCHKSTFGYVVHITIHALHAIQHYCHTIRVNIDEYIFVLEKSTTMRWNMDRPTAYSTIAFTIAPVH